MPSIIILKATLSDAKQIHELAQKNELSKLDGDLSSGFLISAFSISEYKKFIYSPKYYFYVAKENNTVVAFIFAYPNDLIPEKTLEHLTLEYVGMPFFLIKQICVDPNYKKKGIGKRLYNLVLRYCSNQSPTLAAIVLDPLNTTSINFHERMGFNKLFEFLPDDGMKRGIWMKKHITNPDPNILSAQFKETIALYNHEDTLNWSKAYHLFYITIGLVGFLAFCIKNKINEPFIWIFDAVTVSSAIGILASVGFFIAIHNGIKYLMDRKNKLTIIDRALAKKGGVRLTIPEGYRLFDTKKPSPTTWVLKGFPLITGVSWLIVFTMRVCYLLGYCG